MSQSIGLIIKRLRKEKNLTQEELAEQLNVTSQAVSKWENETGMPDISQIVPLANVFNVSTDVLFGRLGVTGNEEAEKSINEAHEVYYKWLNSNDNIEGFFEAVICCYRIIKSALSENPGNYKLNLELAGWGYHIISSRAETYIKAIFTEDKITNIKNESIRCCEFVLKNTHDINEILNASLQMIGIYNTLCEYDKAEEMLCFLPENIACFRGFYKASILSWRESVNEEIKQRSINISVLINCLYDETYRLGKAYYKNEQYNDAIFTYLSMPKIIEAVFPKEDKFYPTLQNCGNNYDSAAFCYLKLGEYEKAIDMLQAEVDFIIAQGALSKDAGQPVSPLIRYCDMKAYAGDMKAKECLKLILNYKQRYAEYAEILEQYPKFNELLEKINALPD